jgi:hypothetical protein
MFLIVHYINFFKAFIHTHTHTHIYIYKFLRQGILPTRPNPQVEGPPLVDCLRFPFQYIRRYSPLLVRLLRPQPVDACHVVLTSTHVEVTNVDGRIILKFILNMRDGGAWTGFVWLMIDASDELYYKRYGLMKRRFPWSAEEFWNSLGTVTSLWGIFGGKMGHCDRSLFQYFEFPTVTRTHTHTQTRQQIGQHQMDSLVQVRQNKINITWVAYKISLRLCTWTHTHNIH